MSGNHPGFVLNVELAPDDDGRWWITLQHQPEPFKARHTAERFGPYPNLWEACHIAAGLDDADKRKLARLATVYPPG